jgi:hypothetical protein
MKAKTAASIVGLVIAGLGFGIGLPLANANQPTGGQCNNYGDHNVVVAPFCGATLVPAPSTGGTTTPTFVTRSLEGNPPTLGPPPSSISTFTRVTGAPTLLPLG